MSARRLLFTPLGDRKMRPIATRLPWMCLVGAGWAFAGCWEEAPPPPTETPPCATVPGLELQVGTSDADGEGFVPYEDGDDVALGTLGQGAFHVFVSYAVRGFDPNALFVHRAVSFAATGEVITQNPERVNLQPPETPSEDTYCTLRSAQFAIVCPTILGRVWDAELEIAIEIEDAAHETAEVVRYFRAVCPEGEDYEDCIAVCDGIPVE